MANYCFFTANKLLQLINLYTKKAKKNVICPILSKHAVCLLKGTRITDRKKLFLQQSFSKTLDTSFLFCLFLEKQTEKGFHWQLVRLVFLPFPKHSIYFKTLAMYFLCVCSRFPHTLHSTNITNCKYFFMHLIFKDDRMCFKIHKIQEYKKNLYKVEKVKLKQLLLE